MTALDLLDASDCGAIAGLCARALARPPSAAEIGGALFAPDQPAVVRGDPEVGVVAAVPGPAGGSIRLLAVDPRHQGRGHGTALLAAAEADLTAGRTEPVTVTVGADPPYFLFPGVETTQLAMLCLLERRHYQRHEANFNMDVDLGRLPEDPSPRDDAGGPAGPVVAAPADREEVAAFLSTHWDNWRPEALRALDKGTLLIERDGEGISGFCAYDVNRAGLLGPIAVRPGLIGKGAGVALLVRALHRMKASGRSSIEVCWVGPILPYARVGGTIGRVFFVYRKQVRP